MRDRLDAGFGTAPGDDVAPLVVPDGTLEAMKWLALLLMTGDHVNTYLLDGAVPVLFAAGRLALPLFVFVLAYNAARPGFFTGGAAKRTCRRLAAYGVIASVPYIALGNVLSGWWPLNIMFTLLTCVGMLWTIESASPASRWRLALLFVVGGAVVEYFWLALLLAAAAWRYASRPSTGRLAVFGAAVAALAIVNQTHWALGVLPFILVAPHLDLGVARAPRFFYAYYPAHLSVLWLVGGHL